VIKLYQNIHRKPRKYPIPDRIHGFNFEQPPFLRLAVFRFSEGDYRWVWTSHHAVLDGRSRLLILQELFAMYRQFLKAEVRGRAFDS
jgi:NRPS condensation-like uncharacterized protein